MIWFTGAIALFGLCSVVVGVLQWSAMRGQLTEMRRGSVDTHALAHSAGKQAGAAEKFSASAEGINKETQSAVSQFSRLAAAAASQAKTSESMASVARDALAQGAKSLGETIEASHLEERPWVVPIRYNLSQEPQNGGSFQVTCWIENTGKTPALDVSETTRLSLRYAEPAPSDLPQNLSPTSRGILPPLAANFSFKTGHLNPGLRQTAGYMDGSMTIYLQGEITYLDTFHESHWTKFCVWHNKWMPNDEFNSCERGNGADQGHSLR
jgi:hypothetical protein